MSSFMFWKGGINGTPGARAEFQVKVTCKSGRRGELTRRIACPDGMGRVDAMTVPVVLIPQPARFLTWLAVGKVKVVGEVPKGAALLCANHASYRDVWLFTLFCPSARLLVHPEVFTFPFLKGWATRKGFVQVSIDDAVTLLRRGEPVAICPTGLVEARGDNELPFKTGAIRIAQQAAVLVVPIYFQYGSYPGPWTQSFSITVQNVLLFLLWPFYRTGVTIHIGKPYAPAGEVRVETNALKAKVAALARA